MGTVVDVPERLMSVAGGCSGVGPAYWALLVEAQVDAAVKRGMPAALAAQLVTETMAGSAELLRARGGDTLAVRREVASPGGIDRARAGGARARRRARRRSRRDGRRGRAADVAEAASRSPSSSSALIWVYMIIIIAWIVVSFVFSMGARVPYSRPLNAVLDFLRDVASPTCGSSAACPAIGPLDLSPIVAILVLRIVGGIIVA